MAVSGRLHPAALPARGPRTRLRVTQTGTETPFFLRSPCRLFVFCQNWRTRSVHACPNEFSSASAGSRCGKVRVRAIGGNAGARRNRVLIREVATVRMMGSLRRQGQFGQ